jgi:lipopolysaccharide/colanic/teichoic acid biosynthesis glycosyltransferase
MSPWTQSKRKRVFDFIASFTGLLLLWPLFLIVAIFIKIDDRGPVFFRQVRVGKNGKPFRIWKFRTMVTDAERMGKPLTVGGDPRITRVGYWLRRTKLDELPQLLNVLLGEMSLVGPRPEVPPYVSFYTGEELKVLELKPGITDPASIHYRHENELLAQAPNPEQVYLERIMPEKIRMNLEYACRASFWTDLCIIVKTMSALLK